MAEGTSVAERDVRCGHCVTACDTAGEGAGTQDFQVVGMGADGEHLHKAPLKP